MTNDKRQTDWPRLFALAVYELNTPMVVVHGYGRLLQSPRSPDERQRMFVEMGRAADQACEVMAKIRELVALEAGRPWTIVEKTEISLGDVIRDAVSTPNRWWDARVATEVLIEPGETTVVAHLDPLKRAVVAVLSWICGELGRKERYSMHIRIADSPEPPCRNL